MRPSSERGGPSNASPTVLRSASRGGACAGEAVNAGTKKEIAYEKFLAPHPVRRYDFVLLPAQKEGDNPNTGRHQQTGYPAAPLTSSSPPAAPPVLTMPLVTRSSPPSATAEPVQAHRCRLRRLKANVQLVTANQAQMSILQSDVLGTMLFTTAPAVRPMFDGADKNFPLGLGVYNETVQLVTAPSITSIEDLKGKTVCVGDVRLRHRSERGSRVPRGLRHDLRRYQGHVRLLLWRR